MSKEVKEQKTKEAPKSDYATFSGQIKAAKEAQDKHREALAKLAKS